MDLDENDYEYKDTAKEKECPFKFDREVGVTFNCSTSDCMAWKKSDRENFGYCKLIEKGVYNAKQC